MSNFTAANRQALADLRRLINTELKDICRSEGLMVSGVKSVLQTRIKDYLEGAISAGDHATQARLHYRIAHGGHGPPPGWSPSSEPSANSNHASHSHSTPQTHTFRPSLPNPGHRAPATVPSRLTFKHSPFFLILEGLCQVWNLPEMPANRNSITIPLALSDNVCERLKADSSLRVMLYCTTPSLMGQYEQNNDISFPVQIEVKLNQEDVKSNYKGLKNKPGTTKPADLTSYLRKQPRYANNLQINYALTTKRYLVVINLVRKSAPDELMNRIKAGRVITKDQVLNDMARKAQDTDIEATSTVLSLKDPVSTMRMDLPCRSTICTHNQCFDALCFLQLQEQAPTWSCPICSKTISYEALVVDNYVFDILNHTSKSVDQVVIEPSGEWKELKPNEEEQKIKTQPRASYDDDSEDDLVEISDVNSGVPLPIRRDTASSMTQHMTPPLSSREASVSGRNKRTSTIIDLTLSDEDEPPRPAKRAHVASSVSYHTPGSVSSLDGNQTRPPPTLYSGFAPNPSPQPLQSQFGRPPPQPGQSAGVPLSPWPSNGARYDRDPNTYRY